MGCIILPTEELERGDENKKYPFKHCHGVLRSIANCSESQAIREPGATCDCSAHVGINLLITYVKLKFKLLGQVFTKLRLTSFKDIHVKYLAMNPLSCTHVLKYKRFILIS